MPGHYKTPLLSGTRRQIVIGTGCCCAICAAILIACAIKTLQLPSGFNLVWHGIGALFATLFAGNVIRASALELRRRDRVDTHSENVTLQ
jgi:multidrug transporter EmrE-like cation transporter